MKRIDSLKKKKEFRYTYRVGKSTSHRLFAVIVAPRRGRERNSRVGISVSKKQGNSVLRNRIKRRLREAVTPLIPGLRPGINVIFVARSGVAEAPFSELRRAAEETLVRAGAMEKGWKP